MSTRIETWSSVTKSVRQVFMNNSRWIIRSFKFLLFLNTLLLSSVFGQSFVGTIFRENLAVGDMAIYEQGNLLCVFDTETQNLLFYNCSSLDLEKELNIPAILDAPFTYLQMVINAAESTLYYFVNTSDAAEVKVICINLFDYSVSKIISIPIISTLYCIYDQAINKMFFFNSNYHYKVSIYNLNTREISKIGLQDVFCTFNPKTHEMIFSFGSQLWVLNGITQQLSFEADMGVNMEDMIMNWIENKIYFLTSAPYDVWIYDRDDGSIKKLDDLNDSQFISFSPGANLVYTSAEIACRSTVIDGKTNSWYYLPMEGGAPRMLFCSATNHAYFIGNDFIGVYDEITQMFEKMYLDYDPQVQESFNYFAYNQTKGLIFLSKGKSYYPPYYNPILVIQDSEMMTRPNVLLGGRYAITVLDPENHGIVDYWYASGEKEITYNPKGSRAYVASRSFYGAATFSVHAGSGAADKNGISAGNFNAKVGSFDMYGQDPIAPVSSLDGSKIYMTCSAKNLIQTIDVTVDSNLFVVNEIEVGKTPWGAALTPEGTKLYVANKGSNNVSVINTASNTVSQTIPVGMAPWGLAINPSGTLAYVANSESGTASVIDLATNSVTANVQLGSNPHWLSFTPDGKFVYISNNNSGSVSVVDAGTNQVTNTIRIVSHPEGICFYPDGSRAYVATDSGASIINTFNFSVDSFSDKNYAPYYSVAIANPSSRFAGRVKNQKGLPVVNALVRAKQEGVEKSSATTNGAGDFCIFYLQKGTYDLELSGPDFSPQSMTALQVDAGQTKIVHFSVPTSVKTSDELPKQFSLSQNYPNPFNPTTLIRYTLPRDEQVKLEAYDTLGRLLITLVDERQMVGFHEVVFQPVGLASGVYFYRLQAGPFSAEKKMLLIR